MGRHIYVSAYAVLLSTGLAVVAQSDVCVPSRLHLVKVSDLPVRGIACVPGGSDTL